MSSNQASLISGLLTIQFLVLVFYLFFYFILFFGYPCPVDWPDLNMSECHSSASGFVDFKYEERIHVLTICFYLIELYV